MHINSKDIVGYLMLGFICALASLPCLLIKNDPHFASGPRISGTNNSWKLVRNAESQGSWVARSVGPLPLAQHMILES